MRASEGDTVKTAEVTLLAARVQWGAFRASPRAYLKALYWRALGLKVRSRSIIEPLAGRSPFAFQLWQVRREAGLRDAWSKAAGIAPIIMIIDLRQGEEGLADTLGSLRLAGPCVGLVLVGASPQALVLGAAFAAERGVPVQACAGPGQLPSVLPQAPHWLCPLRGGDRLAADALARYAGVAEAVPARVIYADDDLCDAAGLRYAPHFKPQWNAELFTHHDFVSYAGIIWVERPALEAFSDDKRGWVANLVETVLHQADGTPQHLPLILHHRRNRPDPHVPATPHVPPSATLPSVTVIVPTRDKLALLETCIAGLERTSYPSFDVIVVDNDSKDPAALAYLAGFKGPNRNVMKHSGPFNFSAMNNVAAHAAHGEYLCFLNNDIEVLEPGWLALLVAQARRPEAGAVGARLLYPDGTIQHAGVVQGVGGGAAHAHRYLRPKDKGYFARHNLPQFVSAVTAACLVVRKERFFAVGGFDEALFAVAFNDVDLCLKLNAAGWQSFYEPRATLVHHESKSRGKDSERRNRHRFAGELAALKEKWHTDTQVDPFHHPALSRLSEQFVVGNG